MTKHEIARKAVRHETTQTLPVGYIFQNETAERNFARQLGMTYEAFQEWAKSDLHDLKLLDELGHYISNEEKRAFALENGFAFTGEIPGALYDRCGIGWSSTALGQEVLHHPLTIEDVAQFGMPNPYTPELFHFTDREVKRAKSAGDGVYISQYFGLFEKAHALVGYENFFIQCYENREAVELLLDKITAYRVAIAGKITQYDVTFGHTGDDYGVQNGPMLSLELWRELFKPRLQKIWSVYKGKGIPVIHHSCGDCSLFLEDMIEIGLDVISPVQATAMDAFELKRRYGGVLSFEGAIDTQRLMYEGTPDEVRAHVEQTVETMASGGGYLLTAINIMNDTPVENVKALVNTMNRYR